MPDGERPQELILATSLSLAKRTVDLCRNENLDEIGITENVSVGDTCWRLQARFGEGLVQVRGIPPQGETPLPQEVMQMLGIEAAGEGGFVYSLPVEWVERLSRDQVTSGPMESEEAESWTIPGHSGRDLTVPRPPEAAA